ncbi:hypothetical protein ABIE28_001981 [Devosia sp. 2618]
MRLPSWFNTQQYLARSLLEAGKGIKAVLQRAGTREAGLKPYSSFFQTTNPPFSPRPNELLAVQ